MKRKPPFSGTFGARNLIIIACAALLVLLIAAAVAVAVVNGTGDMAERADIEAKLEELGAEDRGYKYVARHLGEYGVGGFDAGKLRRIEHYFNTEYPKPLPSVGEMAHKTARLYLDYFYDVVDNSDKEAVTTAILRCYVEATGDSYAVYRTAEELEAFDVDMSGEFVGIGVSVMQTTNPSTGKLSEVRIEAVIAGSGAEDAGILVGDLITKVDGTHISEFDHNSLITAIRGDEGTTVSITVLRGTQEMTFDCQRRKIVEKTVEYEVRDGIGYITIHSFKSNTAEMFAEAISVVRSSKAKGVIFDLRNNPGGYLNSVLSVLDMIAPEGVTLASYDYAGGKRSESKSSGKGSPLTVPVAVICNGNTASAGELFTAALRDFDDMGIMKATIVGTKTYGKGVMQSTKILVGGASITFTTAFYNPPSGVNYEGVGITPDVIVEAGSGSGDAQMEAAQALMRQDVGGDQNTTA